MCHMHVVCTCVCMCTHSDHSICVRAFLLQNIGHFRVRFLIYVACTCVYKHMYVWFSQHAWWCFISSKLSFHVVRMLYICLYMYVYACRAFKACVVVLRFGTVKYCICIHTYIHTYIPACECAQTYARYAYLYKYIYVVCIYIYTRYTCINAHRLPKCST